jgi:prolyl oligopeptidase
VVPETVDTLRSVSLVGGRLVASYLRHAHAVVRVHELDGAFVREVDLPGIGSVDGFGGRQSEPRTFFTYTGFTTPATVYAYDVRDGAATVFRRPEVDFDPDLYVTEQIFVTSRDGTDVPAFVTRRKDVTPDGNRPVFLYGYGGFDIPLTPGFSVSRLVWMEMGGVYVVANLRGGGEYGRSWHEAGAKLRKQNTFDDFVAVAESLVRDGWTRRERLAIGGGSNGGLLVGASMTQRPDLFGACLPDVGVMDMIRFHKFTIGWAWVSDYGSPDDPEEFRALLSYSPLHNVRPGTCYPPTLISTGDHDDRVVPAHSFKFAATLQAAQGCDNPILIRIETRAGHGAGKPTDKLIDEIADKWAFLVKVLGL